MKHNLLNYTLTLSFLTGCQPSNKISASLDSSQYHGVTGTASSSLAKMTDAEALKNIINNSSLPLTAKALLAKNSDTKISLSGNKDINSLQSAQIEYQKQQEKISDSLELLNNRRDKLSYVMTAASMGLSMLPATAPAAVGIEILNTAYTKSMDLTISALEKNGQEKASRVLADRLKSVSASDVKAFDALKKLKPEQAQKEAEKLVDRLFPEEYFKDMPTEARAEARAIASQWTARTAISNLEKFKSVQDFINNTNTKDIANAKKDLLATGSAMKQFAKETKQNLEALAESQNEIAMGLQKVSDGVASSVLAVEKISENVDFLRDFTFSRLSPREQLEDLKKNIKADASQEQKDKLVLLEKKIDFEEGYKKHFEGAQHLVTIAKNLGVDSKLVSDISNGLAKVDMLKTGIQMFAGQNYLAGAAAISGLFGGGGLGDDGSAARHQEIIARLDRVLENQQIMTDLIKQSFEIQVGLLNQISNQIRSSTELLYGKMDSVHNDVLGNRVLLKGLTLKGLVACESAALELSRKTFPVAIERANFRSHITTCSLDYEHIFNRKNYDVFFGSGTYKTAKNNETMSADERNFNESIRFIKTEYKGTFSPSVSLKNPNHNAYGLLVKLNYLAEKSSRDFSKNELEIEMGKYESRFFAPAVINVLQNMVTLFPYIAIWNARLSDAVEDVLNVKKLRPNAGYEELESLESAIELVNQSIQQESLVAGDILLPLLYRKFPELQTENVDCQTNTQYFAKCVLANNDTLRSNFVIFGLYNEFYQNKGSLSAYRQALRIPNDANALNRILKNNWKISWNTEQNRYETALAGKANPLPSFEAVASGTFVVNRHLGMLLRTRDELINLKVEATMNKTLADEQKNTIHSLVIK